ncbi:MAG: methyl-accepting chemotaxis protein, partial [Bacillota bacterium]
MKGKKNSKWDYRASLLVRMVALFGSIVLLGCLSLFLVSERQAGSVLENAADEALQQLAKQAAETVDSRIQARLYVVQAVAERNVIRGKAGDRAATREEQLQVLREELQRAESLGFKDMGIADRTGNAFFASGKSASAAGRDYFQAALAGKTAITSTIVSKLDNSVVFVYAVPIRHYASNEISGVLIGVVDGAKFSELVKSITYGRTGYGFAVDSTGKTIAHKDEKLVLEQKNFIEIARSDQSLTALAEIVSKMAKGETGLGQYTYQGQEKILAYVPIKSTGWSLGVNVPKAEVLERVSGLKQSLLLVSLFIILLALVFTFAIARSIARPITLAVDHLGLIAGGDFTRPVPEQFLSRRDEIGRLVQAIDQLQARLKPVLAGLADDAQTLAANSEELAASAQQVSATVQEVAGTSSEVAAMAEKSLENATHTAGESQKVVALAESGGETLQKTIDKINSIAQSSARMSQSIQNLGELSGRIGNITNIITGIADQTNLLALNAAIEAARAGEQGRGFAVVAEEVRKLAEQSASAAREIDQLIQQIQAGVETAVRTMEQGSSEVREGVELASQA